MPGYLPAAADERQGAPTGADRRNGDRGAHTDHTDARAIWADADRRALPPIVANAHRPALIAIADTSSAASSSSTERRLVLLVPGSSRIRQCVKE